MLQTFNTSGFSSFWFSNFPSEYYDRGAKLESKILLPFNLFRNPSTSTYIPDKETDSFLFCMKSFQCRRSPNTKSALAYEFAFQHGHARMAFCLSSCYLSPSRRMKTRCSGVFGVFSANMSRSGQRPNMQMKQRNPRSIFSPLFLNKLRLKGRPFRH